MSRIDEINLERYTQHIKNSLANKQDTLTAGDNIVIENNEISADLSNYYTKSQVKSGLKAKQDTLTAGANITITEDNVISATGGSVNLTTYTLTSPLEFDDNMVMTLNAEDTAFFLEKASTLELVKLATIIAFEEAPFVLDAFDFSNGLGLVYKGNLQGFAIKLIINSVDFETATLTFKTDVENAPEDYLDVKNNVSTLKTDVSTLKTETATLKSKVTVLEEISKRAGTVWYANYGRPNHELGYEGDFYFDKAAKRIYQKFNGVWGGTEEGEEYVPLADLTSEVTVSKVNELINNAITGALEGSY